MDESAFEGAEVSELQLAAWSWLSRGDAEGISSIPPAGVRSTEATEVSRAHLRGVLEALLFAADHSMSIGELVKASGADRRQVKAIVAELQTFYKGRGFRLDEVAGGFVFRTNPVFSPFVREMTSKKPVKMSRAQIETLSIIAYRQPITRPEIDDIRGVDSGAVLKALLERDLIRILGKREEPGRPIIYGTASGFLEFFNLKSLSDLPTLREFTELNDESRRTYEREMGEEPPDMGEGFAGGEGEMVSVDAPSSTDWDFDPEAAKAMEEAERAAAGESDASAGDVALEGDETQGEAAESESDDDEDAEDDEDDEDEDADDDKDDDEDEDEDEDAADDDDGDDNEDDDDAAEDDADAVGDENADGDVAIGARDGDYYDDDEDDEDADVYEDDEDGDEDDDDDEDDDEDDEDEDEDDR